MTKNDAKPVTPKPENASAAASAAAAASAVNPVALPGLGPATQTASKLPPLTPA